MICSKPVSKVNSKPVSSLDMLATAGHCAAAAPHETAAAAGVPTQPIQAALLVSEKRARDSGTQGVGD